MDFLGSKKNEFAPKNFFFYFNKSPFFRRNAKPMLTLRQHRFCIPSEKGTFI